MTDIKHFDGPAYVPALDYKRLSGQILRIFNLMKDGKWRTLREIEWATNDPQASISAQLRHLKKLRFGNHNVPKRRRGDPNRGIWEYKLILRDDQLKLEI